jgi:hypothetical protein
VEKRHLRPNSTLAAIAAHPRACAACAYSILKFHSGEAKQSVGGFLRSPADPRYLANDSRSAAETEGLS